MPHKIELCTHTENPITGCRHASGRCSYCYARRMAHRLASNPNPGAAPYRAAAQLLGDPFSPALHLRVLEDMRHRLVRCRRERRVFLGSMADVCSRGDWAVLNRDELVATWTSALVQHAIAGTCASLPWHQFLILTKSPMHLIDGWTRNVWLGVSCPDTAAGRDNVAALLHAPVGGGAGRHWASVEPLLDPEFDPIVLDGLDWVVLGAMTGPGALHPDTPEADAIVRAAWRVVDWAERHRVPVFTKRNLRQLDESTFWPQQFPGGVSPCP
jgi:protein gp37